MKQIAKGVPNTNTYNKADNVMNFLVYLLGAKIVVLNVKSLMIF
jgi:hypothetical protein